jgi:hypothetical protein|tara:strand:- start:166 stop:798 length:633 start_codon:yes stop_codon:yes gene_type:complete
MAKGKKGIELGKKIVEKVKKRKDGKPDQRFKNNKAVSVKAAEQKARQDVVRNAAIATGVLGTGTAAVIGSKNKQGKTFNDAFRAARAKGEGTKFTFNGKSYVAVTKDDLKKKGYSTLAEYNRAGGKKKIDVDAAAKKIADAVNKNKKPKTMRERIRARRKKRIGFETFKERRQARRAARKMKSGGVVSSKKSTPRGVGAAKRGFGKALRS